MISNKCIGISYMDSLRPLRHYSLPLKYHTLTGLTFYCRKKMNKDEKRGKTSKNTYFCEMPQLTIQQ